MKFKEAVKDTIYDLKDVFFDIYHDKTLKISFKIFIQRMRDIFKAFCNVFHILFIWILFFIVVLLSPFAVITRMVKK